MIIISNDGNKTISSYTKNTIQMNSEIYNLYFFIKLKIVFKLYVFYNST